MERAHQDLVEDRVLEPGAVLGQRARMFEVFCGRVLDHAVLDVAAFCWVVVDEFHTDFKPTHVGRK